MGNPRVATIGVVLDDEEETAGAEMTGQAANDLHLSVARHEVQAVGGNQAVQRCQIQ